MLSALFYPRLCTYDCGEMVPLHTFRHRCAFPCPSHHHTTIPLSLQEIVDKRDDLEDDDAYDVVPGTFMYMCKMYMWMNTRMCVDT